MFSSLPSKWIDFFLAMPFAALSQRHRRHEILDDRNLRNSSSCSLQFRPRIRLVCEFKFRTIFSCDPGPKNDQYDRERIYEHILQLSVDCVHIFLYFLFSHHAMSLYIDMKMLLSLKNSCSHCRSLIRL